MPQTSDKPSIPELEQTLLDTKIPLFQRYRAMFALRDLSSPPDLPTAVPAVTLLPVAWTTRLLSSATRLRSSLASYRTLHPSQA